MGRKPGIDVSVNSCFVAFVATESVSIAISWRLLPPDNAVIFDRSHVTVRNVQARCCYQQDSLQAYIGWLLCYMSSLDAPLAVDSFPLTDVDMPKDIKY